MIVLPVLFLSLTSIVCTAVRAADVVGDLFGRNDDLGLAHSARDLYPTALGDPFDARDEGFNTFVRRAADMEYDDLLYTREILDYLFASDYVTREVDFDSAPDFERRATPIDLVLRRMEEHPRRLFDIEVTPGVTTWATVKDDITGQTNGALDYREIHIRHQGKEPKDEDVVPIGTRDRAVIRFYMDEDLPRLNRIVNARSGAGPSAGVKGSLGKVKKGAKGNGKKPGAVGRKAAANKAKVGKK